MGILPLIGEAAQVDPANSVRFMKVKATLTLGCNQWQQVHGFYSQALDLLSDQGHFEEAVQPAKELALDTKLKRGLPFIHTENLLTNYTTTRSLQTCASVPRLPRHPLPLGEHAHVSL
ncbi:hypothetical protein P4N68_09040 [Corynebacterium felinum]|uniref:Uncharacterized protein n=1 Tax=Corynebacterium felinum TaxID=131318 RepID=A0ABU2B588_9CORY|nr:hypothetical protein [Corynebacterium felinum]MDF5821219.1 hypothetical protein [Corynebacterium felinum]MDR7353780.1 hypothetical protein [Corynebacterium felinum]WJY95959.1 hypothetical protein CFELI_11890 [Corynebacterium felinum]